MYPPNQLHNPTTVKPPIITVNITNLGRITSQRAAANIHGISRSAEVDKSRIVCTQTLEPGHTGFREKRLGTVGSFETATSVAAEANSSIMPVPEVLRNPAIDGRKKLKKGTVNKPKTSAGVIFGNMSNPIQNLVSVHE